MSVIETTFLIDEIPLPFKPGQTILEGGAVGGGVYIPHLCHHREFAPHGSCKLWSIAVNGRNASACTMEAAAGQEVEVDLHAYRRTPVQMLFVEGNHFCPGCEQSGNCQLQALAYGSEMMTPHFVEFCLCRPVNGSHPDVLLNFNRCIQCELCVRASRDVEGKSAATWMASLSLRSPGAAWPFTSPSIRRACRSATRTSRSPTRPRMCARSAPFS